MAEKQAPTYKSAANVLQNAHSALGYLISHAKQLQKWNDILYRYLPTNEHKHCQIGGFEQRILTLIVDSATWATKLRYQTPELIENLQRTHEFQSLKEIKCLVQPKNDESKNDTQADSFKKTRQLLQETSDGITDPELKTALQKFLS